MDGTIQYLNTDVDLRSQDDLTALAAALNSAGIFSLHVTPVDGLWHATFETDVQYTEPEPNIDAILVAVESLPISLRAVWNRCSLRELNIGYDCGDEPWAFNQCLSAGMLARIASAGCTLRITLYPQRDPINADSGNK